MAPTAQSELDFNNHTSDLASRDSPLRRQFSEHTSTQTSPSPSPMTDKTKCDWCGEYFNSPSGDAISRNEALKHHIATVHPHIAKFEMYDGTTDDEGSQINDDEEHVENGDDAALTHAGENEDDDTAVNVAEDAETYANEKADMDAGEEPEGEVPEGESDLALSNQLHEFSREQDSVSLDKRLHNFWNVHDIRKFSQDYDSKTTGINKTWTTVFHEPKRGKKRDMAEPLERPDPYKKTKVGRGEFLEISPLEDFLVQLRDPEMRSSDELYAITENVAYALKAWQDEYLAIDKLHKVATRHHAKPTSDPRKLERPQVFEDKKEAMLYGYKHDPKEDKVGNQNPFLQGGFKPTPAQARKMTAKAGPNNPNPDGWPIVMKFGVEHVPKFQNPPREEFVGKATRKRKAAEMEAATRAQETDEAPGETPAPPEPEEHPGKRRARTRRQAAEAEEEETANGLSARNPPRGRGSRVRGRGATRVVSRGNSETPITPAPTTTSRSNLGPSQTDGASPSRSGKPQLVPIEPAPSGGTAAVSTNTAHTAGVQDEAIDAAELARRQKIANSKNPKRTEAMLNHWARFNREGRVRNPKRSKAQIEADRAAEAAKKATEPAKAPGKKKKSASPAFGGSARAEGALAPARPTLPVSTSLAPGPPTQPPQLAPLPTPRGPIAPFPPPSMAPFPPGPRGPLQPPPPQPYHTPYPDYYIPYGAPTGLPPPGHPRPA